MDPWEQILPIDERAQDFVDWLNDHLMHKRLFLRGWNWDWTAYWPNRPILDIGRGGDVWQVRLEIESVGRNLNLVIKYQHSEDTQARDLLEEILTDIGDRWRHTRTSIAMYLSDLNDTPVEHKKRGRKKLTEKEIAECVEKVRQALKLRAERGLTWEEAASKVHVHVSTLMEWKKKYYDGKYEQ